MTDRLIYGRHIRHDWKGFVDWDQKSVRTECGKTSRRGLAGIPTVTSQEIFPIVDGKAKFGWCPACVRSVVVQLGVIERTQPYMLPAVRELFSNLSEEIFPIYAQYQVLEQQRREQRLGRPRPRNTSNSTTA